ncbi:DUF1376 domain-containing protein [Burkholderia sp. JPY481]
MTELPGPLTPPDCDLRNFPYMPLEVARLCDSDLAALESPEACWAALLLWCKAWHQVPAASLPDDDRVLAKLTGYQRSPQAWLSIRAGALRGWVKCADGRLYHPVVAEKAREAWLAKLTQRFKTECARIKKHCERHGLEYAALDFDDWLAAGRPCGQPLKKAVPTTTPECPDDNPMVSLGQLANVAGTLPQCREENGSKRTEGNGIEVNTIGSNGGVRALIPDRGVDNCLPLAAVDGFELLRSLERVRGKTMREPTAQQVAELAARAPTDVEGRKAHELGVKARERDKDGTAINPGFWLRMIDEVRKPPKPKSLASMTDDELMAEAKRWKIGTHGLDRWPLIAAIQKAIDVQQGAA